MLRRKLKLIEDPRESSDSGAATPVRLIRRGQGFEINPPCDDLALEFLSLRNSAAAKDGQCRVESLPVRLVVRRCTGAFHDREEMIANAGLESLVAEWLQRQGRKVIFEGDRPSPLGSPAPLPPGGVYPDPAILKFVQQFDRGVVRYQPDRIPDAFESAWFIAQIAKAYPQARIVVAVTRTADAKKLQRTLQRTLNRPVLRVHSGHHPCERLPIVVGTYAHLGSGEGELELRDFLFAADPVGMVRSDCGTLTLKNAKRARTYAFLRQDQQLTDFERDSIISVFGPKELAIPAPGVVASPVEVIFLKTRGGPALKAVDTLDLLRTGIWEHPIRNRRVATLARALAANDVTALDGQFPALSQRLQGEAAGRVGVLAGSVDHAATLAAKLPGWKVISAEGVDLDRMAAQLRAAFETGSRQSSRASKGIIITPGGLSRVRRLGVLIRADGDVGIEPLASTKCFQVSKAGQRAPLVIDFDDCHHTQLKDRSQRRKAGYLDVGWHLPVELKDDLDYFLHRRPRRL
jgi:hypothetical protein